MLLGVACSHNQNIANPVSGADAAGATVNNTMVTLTVDIDGNPQTGTFFVNHNEDQTVTLTFTGIGGTTMAVVTQ